MLYCLAVLEEVRHVVTVQDVGTRQAGLVPIGRIRMLPSIESFCYVVMHVVSFVLKLTVYCIEAGGFIDLENGQVRERAVYNCSSAPA